MRSDDLFSGDGKNLHTNIGISLRDHGINRALDAEPPDRLCQARAFVRRFGATRTVWIAEEARAAWLETGEADLHSPACWGALMKSLSEANVIETTGRFVRCKSPLRRGGRVLEWRIRP